jgi:hypothetical protein
MLTPFIDMGVNCPSALHLSSSGAEEDSFGERETSRSSNPEGTL